MGVLVIFVVLAALEELNACRVQRESARWRVRRLISVIGRMDRLDSGLTSLFSRTLYCCCDFRRYELTRSSRVLPGSSAGMELTGWTMVNLA
jgi:hypothetical protein